MILSCLSMLFYFCISVHCILEVESTGAVYVKLQLCVGTVIRYFSFK
jgi:hypothetical protein